MDFFSFNKTLKLDQNIDYSIEIRLTYDPENSLVLLKYKRIWFYELKIVNGVCSEMRSKMQKRTIFYCFFKRNLPSKTNYTEEQAN